jgi:hypothetical protein
MILHGPSLAQLRRDLIGPRLDEVLPVAGAVAEHRVTLHHDDTPVWRALVFSFAQGLVSSVVSQAECPSSSTSSR